MKKIFYSFIFAFLLVSCQSEQNVSSDNGNIKSRTGQLNIKGSDTELPLCQKEIESFTTLYPEASISLTGGGSSVGVTALIEGNTDIAMVSREISTEENLKLETAGQKIKQVVIAYDALAVVVNPANTLDSITREQIEGIYTGNINSWLPLNGKPSKISAIGRENSSGSYAFFKDHVLKGKNYDPGIIQLPSNGQIIETVSQNQDAIGYAGLGYVNSKVKVLSVSFDGGKTFKLASSENVKNKKYPISRPLYYVYPVNAETKVKPFIDYVLSKGGQQIVEDVGFVRVN